MLKFSSQLWRFWKLENLFFFYYYLLFKELSEDLEKWKARKRIFNGLDLIVISNLFLKCVSYTNNIFLFQIFFRFLKLSTFSNSTVYSIVYTKSAMASVVRTRICEIIDVYLNFVIYPLGKNCLLKVAFFRKYDSFF